MGLAGPISPSIGNLTYLSKFHLPYNNLSGAVPPELGQLSNLQVLNLSFNALGGSIPPTLGSCRALRDIDLTDNKLAGNIPFELGSLSELRVLNLGSNELAGRIPPWPIPILLANASGLVQIDLSSNKFSGRIPANIGSLQQLSWLGLENNTLEAKEASDWNFLSSLTNCTMLKFLGLGGNELAGKLPRVVANLSTQLQMLSMGQNQLTGVIPPEIDNLVNLNTLMFEQNRLSGRIPDSLGRLIKLEALILFSNKFSGKIPHSFGNFTQMNELYLQGNELFGEIPPSLSNYQNLNILDLSDNRLSGSIPKELLDLSSLSDYLNLSNNFLSGPLPSEVGSLSNLGVLDISNNNLSARIPETIGSCQILEYLSLENNFFEGPIPTTLKNLRGLKVLDLSHNNLSGPFPNFLADLLYLQNLNLSFNDFDGEVLEEGVFKNASVVSVIGNNHLCGGVVNLHLPPCAVQIPKKDRGVVIKVTVPVVCGILLFSLLLVTYFLTRKMKNKHLVTANLGNHMKVSYAELLKATDGFSFNNLIGVGSYGSVFKGVLTDGRTVVAVKVLNLQKQEAFKTFVAECETLRNIRHRNLVKIVTTCASVDSWNNDFRALVLEYMPNGSLENWLHPEPNAKAYSRRLSLVERLNIVIDVATALNYLHSECEIPIVHCDLKPSNVLLDENFTAHVGDFGLARFLPKSNNNAHRDPSSSIAIKGSIGYVAPEYGMGGHVSTQGDVYSFGILLLELFTGRRPTDNMFKDGLTLQICIEEAITKGTKAILLVDPALFSEVREQIVLGVQNGSKESERTELCLISVLKVGLSCVKEQPRDRMTMKDVVTQLLAIRELLLS
uniref:Receptor kinase-like protein Xa21 n=1 Tax=Ananas comosus var. bracteatus TaxID=296719 RepID=A0A6V7NGM4_ANACO|nr:unnamed protein product [Ananas comosus var. bracteatus]